MHRDTHVPAQGEVTPMPNPMVPDSPPPITGDISTQRGHRDTKQLQHLCCSFPVSDVPLFATCQPKLHSPTLCKWWWSLGGFADRCPMTTWGSPVGQ